jgi:arylsulfatase A-like enzyme
LSCYGEMSIQTPAVDGLASEGVLFRNHFCTAPFCSPSREGRNTNLKTLNQR